MRYDCVSSVARGVMTEVLSKPKTARKQFAMRSEECQFYASARTIREQYSCTAQKALKGNIGYLATLRNQFRQARAPSPLSLGSIGDELFPADLLQNPPSVPTLRISSDSPQALCEDATWDLLA